LGSGSFGGKVDVLLVRTATVAAGGELGFFSTGSKKTSHWYRDSVHGDLRFEYDTQHEFWHATAVARYSLPGNQVVFTHLILSTGFYRFGSREAVDGRDPDGIPVEWATYVSESRGLVPGVGAGLGLLIPLGWNGSAIDIEVRAHAMIGAGEAIYPAVTVTAGLRRQLANER
jgi:hypothetical protein